LPCGASPVVHELVLERPDECRCFFGNTVNIFETFL
jgi:hypothetical protein